MFPSRNQRRYAFLQERSQKYLRENTWLWSVFRGRAQKDVLEAAMFEQKKIKKTTSDVPEIRLFKLFIIGLKKKDNGEAALCWSHFIFFPRSNAVTT